MRAVFGGFFSYGFSMGVFSGDSVLWNGGKKSSL